MTLAEEVAANLARVQTEVSEAARQSGRTPDKIELVAVSKTHAAKKVQAAAEAGQTLFGESRVQEARIKIPLLPARLRWHFIGHLQKNKIRHALPLFEVFHGIDSLALAQDMQRIADEDGMQPRVLLEVNLAGEASKHGFTPEAVRRDLEAVLSLGRLTVEGLMTIPPFAPEAEASRRYFAALRGLRDQLEADFGVRLPQLSMGMSGDYTVAIEEGATLVRVGTAIFGERSRRKPE
ncbi:MAG: YggS family pyridoxal phosphate-dependent enzyme [Chthoniobacterales bacterium]